MVWLSQTRFLVLSPHPPHGLEHADHADQELNSAPASLAESLDAYIGPASVPATSVINMVVTVVSPVAAINVTK